MNRLTIKIKYNVIHKYINRDHSVLSIIAHVPTKDIIDSTPVEVF